MRATEIIRSLLDIIDQLDNNYDPLDCENPANIVLVQPEEQIQTSLDTNRFKHIFSMLDSERNNPQMYNNTPNEVFASIDAVTKDAGGGWNGPKNPADIRADSFSMYPNHQHRPE